jgi:hypothetical protein
MKTKELQTDLKRFQWMEAVARSAQDDIKRELFLLGTQTPMKGVEEEKKVED